MSPDRRYPILVAFLQQSVVDITDELVDMFDHSIAQAYARRYGNRDRSGGQCNRIAGEQADPIRFPPDRPGSGCAKYRDDGSRERSEHRGENEGGNQSANVHGK